MKYTCSECKEDKEIKWDHTDLNSFDILCEDCAENYKL